MKKIVTLILAAIGLLTGCNKTSVNSSIQSQEPQEVLVESISTTKANIELFLDDTYFLDYKILPSNATNKTISLDTTYLNNIARVTIDDKNDVIIYGDAVGCGILSLVTTNNKFVSYSITVKSNALPQDTTTQATIKEAEDVVEYFNSASTKGTVFYHSSNIYTGWVLNTDLGTSTSDSVQTLSGAIEIFRQFLPLKNVVDGGYLTNFGCGYKASTYESPAYCVSIDVSPTCFAAVSIFSYIEDTKLIVDVYIYDGRDGLYSTLEF